MIQIASVIYLDLSHENKHGTSQVFHNDKEREFFEPKFLASVTGWKCRQIVSALDNLFFSVKTSLRVTVAKFLDFACTPRVQVCLYACIGYRLGFSPLKIGMIVTSKLPSRTMVWTVLMIQETYWRYKKLNLLISCFISFADSINLWSNMNLLTICCLVLCSGVAYISASKSPPWNIRFLLLSHENIYFTGGSQWNLELRLLFVLGKVNFNLTEI